MHKNLLIGTAIVAVCTLLFYTTGIDWSWARDSQNFRFAIVAYLLAACIGVLPYGLLAALLIRLRPTPLFQVVSFVLVVALSIAAFTSWRVSGVNTAGWDFVLVPVWQSAVIAALFVVSCLVTWLKKPRPD